MAAATAVASRSKPEHLAPCFGGLLCVGCRRTAWGGERGCGGRLCVFVWCGEGNGVEQRCGGLWLWRRRGSPVAATPLRPAVFSLSLLVPSSCPPLSRPCGCVFPWLAQFSETIETNFTKTKPTQHTHTRHFILLLQPRPTVGTHAVPTLRFKVTFGACRARGTRCLPNRKGVGWFRCDGLIYSSTNTTAATTLHSTHLNKRFCF